MKYILLIAAMLTFASCGEDFNLIETPINVTELAPQFEIQSNTFLVGDTKDLIIRVRNTGSSYSEGPIKLLVSGYSAFSIGFDPTATEANTLISTKEVANQNFASYKGADFMYLESPLSIAPGKELRVAFTVTAVDAGKLNYITVSLNQGSGGDISSTNNVITKVLVIAQ